MVVAGTVIYDAFDLMLCPRAARLPWLSLATFIMSLGASLASTLFLGYWRLYQTRSTRLAALATPLLAWWPTVGTLLLALAYWPETRMQRCPVPPQQLSPFPYPAAQLSHLIPIGEFLALLGWILWAMMVALWGAAMLSLRYCPNPPPLASAPGVLFIIHAPIQLAILALLHYPTGAAIFMTLACILALAITWQTGSSLK